MIFHASPLAEAIGWTLLHSLWEGAFVAAALAVAMLVGFAFTLLHLLPEANRSFGTHQHQQFPLWNFLPGGGGASGWDLHLAAIVPWFAPPWIAGVLAFYLWHAASWISVSRLRRRGVCSASQYWQQRLATLSAGLRLSRPVELLESCLVDTPMVLGHLRPVILMPVGLLTGLPVRHVEAILLHELAHIRRHDYLINVLQRFVEGLMFYHPAAWWISRVIRAERENCCDDAAVAMSGDSREYASALAMLEENRQPFREPALAATGGNLVNRIHRLLYPGRPRGAWAPVFAAIALMTVATAGLTAWQTKPAEQREDTLAVVVRDSPHDKWLTDDVVYIISDDERAAYLKLTTDDERTKFIEQFWLRRDPTPGTNVNEFKEEHYRRIAYANGRFPSGRPGWQTDRGHMYIVYGPPDEIEAHPSGEPGFFPHETWKYQFIEGIGSNLYFTFIDRNKNGQYQLAPASDH